MAMMGVMTVSAQQKVESLYALLFGFRLQPFLVGVYVFISYHVTCRFPQSPCVSFPSARQRHSQWESTQPVLRCRQYQRAACTSLHQSCKPSRRFIGHDHQIL